MTYLIQQFDCGHWSRNRNLDAFEDPKVVSAYRLASRLKRLRQCLAQAIDRDSPVELVEVERRHSRFKIKFHFRHWDLFWTAHVGRSEWKILQENPALARVLATAEA